MSTRVSRRSLFPIDSNQAPLPVPKGTSYYARAKQAEYIAKDLHKAQELYTKAILAEDRAESAIKDLVGVLHQLGQTHDAIACLKRHERLFTDENKYKHLLQNLNRQIVQKGNRLNKFLRVSHLPRAFTPAEVKQLFAKPGRIQKIECYEAHALLKFGSHSAARKTLESYSAWEVFKVEWVSVTGDVAAEALPTKEPVQDKALFLFRLFLKETQERAFYVDGPPQDQGASPDLSDEDQLSALGPALVQSINI